MSNYSDGDGYQHKTMYIKTVFSEEKLAIQALEEKLKQEYPENTFYKNGIRDISKSGIITINTQRTDNSYYEFDIWIKERDFE